MQTATIHNHRTGEVRVLTQMQATEQTRLSPEWSFSPPPPPGWERETPKFQATRDVTPDPRARVRTELPFESCSNPDTWQYGIRPIKAGEIVSTTEWPHESFRPLNYAAEKVLEFFTTGTKSRMQRSPWLNDRIHLDDGLSGSLGPMPAPRFPVELRTR